MVGARTAVLNYGWEVTAVYQQIWSRLASGVYQPQQQAEDRAGAGGAPLGQ